MRKQREHGVDGHMSARRHRKARAAGGQRMRMSAVRCCGGGAVAANGYVSRGVTSLQVSSKQHAPVQRWWYTRANAAALQRARS